MKLSQFKFKLPEEKIALYPPLHRDEARMMVLHRTTGKIEHKLFKQILDYYDEHDVFVFNDTKVFPARLYGLKEKTGARICASSIPSCASGMCLSTLLARYVSATSSSSAMTAASWPR